MQCLATNNYAEKKKFKCYLDLHGHHHQLWYKILHPTWKQQWQNKFLSWLTIPSSPLYVPACMIPTNTEEDLSDFLKYNLKLPGVWTQTLTRTFKEQERNITSLKKSPCIFSSASMALSRIPPDVALVKNSI